MTQRLYIIGNGFDLHHEIPSSYEDFRFHVARRDPETMRVVEKYILRKGEAWNNFESRLGELEPDEVASECGQFMVSPGADNWSDSAQGDYQYEVQRIVDALSDVLVRQFRSWVGALAAPPTAGSKKVNLDERALFLSFNYTSTLEDFYGIEPSRVLHLHGVQIEPASVIVGHGRDGVHLPQSEEDDTRFAEGQEILGRYFVQTRKPVPDIIARNGPFFEQLACVQQVIVLGFSLNPIDLPYIQKIVTVLPGACQWKVSWYREEEVDSQRRALIQAGVAPERIEFRRIGEAVESLEVP